MIKVLKLFINELLNISKYAIAFVVVAVFLYTLSISLWCFSIGIVDGYKRFLDDTNPTGIELSLHNYNIDDYKKLNALGGYVEAIMNGVTYYPTISFNGKTSQELSGTSLYFRDELLNSYQQTVFIGRAWNNSDNTNDNGGYSIFLSDEVANEIDVNVNDIVVLNYVGGQEEFKVVGIYVQTDKIYDSFVIPFNFLYDLNTQVSKDITLVFHLDMASDVLTICPALQKMGITYSSLYLTVEEVDLMNTTKIILYVLAIIVIIITFFVLNNVLTLILQGRQKYMARLKILGASSAMVAIIYYTTLILSFLVAFILAVALSSLFCGYFTTVANSLLSFESAIVLRWEAVVVLFCIGLVFLSIFYLLFYRKMKKISPLSYIRSL